MSENESPEKKIARLREKQAQLMELAKEKEKDLKTIKNNQMTSVDDPWSEGGDTPNSGYVYVIQDLDSGLFKIGYTKTPDRRFDELGVGLTSQEISCDYFDNAREVEKAAHEKYADARLPQSEYFKLYKPPVIEG